MVGGAPTRNVLLTGAAGFIGRHALPRLREAGHRVTSLVRGPTDLPGPVVDCDLSDTEELVDHLVGRGIDTVVHAAWSGHPRTPGMDDGLQERCNVRPAERLVEACGRADVPTMVLLSSGGALTSDQPTSTYGVAKLQVERVLAAATGLTGVSLRPSPVYGPGQDPTSGLGAVVTFAWRMLLGEPIHLLGGGGIGRDFLHVDDLADLIVAVVERPVGGIFEVGGPEVHRLEDVVEALERELGVTAAVTMEPAPASDPGWVGLDNGRTSRTFGWEPTRHLTASLPELVADLRGRLGRAGSSAPVVQVDTEPALDEG